MPNEMTWNMTSWHKNHIGNIFDFVYIKTNEKNESHVKETRTETP